MDRQRQGTGYARVGQSNAWQNGDSKGCGIIAASLTLVRTQQTISEHNTTDHNTTTDHCFIFLKYCIFNDSANIARMEAT